VPDSSLTEYVLRHAARLPDKPALIDGTDGPMVTYGELAETVRRVATGLAERGVVKGDVVAVYTPNLIEYPALVLAVASLGGVVTPMNPRYTAEEVGRQLRDSGARFMFTTPPLLETAQDAAQGESIHEIFTVGFCPDAVSFAELASSPDAPPNRVLDRGDLVALPYSSGTTGLPKGVMLTHGHLVTNLCQWEAMGESDTFSEEDVILGVLPFFHIYGMVIVQMVALAAGASLVVLPRFDLQSMLDLVEKHRITVLPIVPPIALAVARDQSLASRDLSSVRMVLCGAAPLRADLEARLSDVLGCPVIQGYGMTEATAATHAGRTRAAVRKPGSIGRLVPGTEARIVDLASGADLTAGMEGELLIRGPQIMRGYLNQPEKTAECVDVDGWYHTGDVGCVDGDGDFFIVDRTKELIKYKGFAVAPAELEALLLTHPSVADAAVVRHPDDEAGEVPRAFIVANPGYPVEQLHAEAIMTWISDRVAPHKRIRLVEFVDEIPRSPAGKILRRLLIERDTSLPAKVSQ
jgi:acyl-CoA synthetase (AMP-forming)/AMP-acid ligase II